MASGNFRVQHRLTKLLRKGEQKERSPHPVPPPKESGRFKVAGYWTSQKQDVS